MNALAAFLDCIGTSVVPRLAAGDWSEQDTVALNAAIDGLRKLHGQFSTFEKAHGFAEFPGLVKSITDLRATLEKAASQPRPGHGLLPGFDYPHLADRAVARTTFH